MKMVRSERAKRLSSHQYEVLCRLAQTERPVDALEVDTSWRTINVLIDAGFVRNRRRFGWTMRTIVITQAGEAAVAARSPQGTA